MEKLTFEFLLKFREQQAELQNMVGFCNRLQSNFDSLHESFVILSNPTMTKGEGSKKGKGRGKKAAPQLQINEPPQTQIVASVAPQPTPEDAQGVTTRSRAQKPPKGT